MATLLIDAGNSRLKWALCSNGQLEVGDPIVYQWSSLEQQLTAAWQSITEKNLSPTKIFLINVAGSRVLEAVSQWRDNTLEKVVAVKETSGVTIEIVAASASAYGVKNAYRQPETLGADRWAALVAARQYVNGDACIVSCGTALTIDILTADGVHAGGIIAPGWDMMESSLAKKIKNITSAEGEVSSLLGKTTQQAVQAGISAASVGAVEYILQRCQHDMDTVFTCIVTGGSAPFLLPNLLSQDTAITFQHEPDWVLKGLAVISENPAENGLADDYGARS